MSNSSINQAFNKMWQNVNIKIDEKIDEKLDGLQIDLEVATTTSDGLMSSADKVKLDGIEANATSVGKNVTG